MGDVKTALAPYMGWIKILGCLILAWKLWPMIGGFFGLIVPPLVKLGDDIQDTVQESHDKDLVKKVNPTANGETASKFRKDAETLATSLGYNPKDYKNKVIPDRALAFTTAKDYSKYIMYGSKAITDKNNKKIERAKGLQLTVLYPIYAEITGGRKLDADLMAAFAGLANKERHDIYVAAIRA